VTQKFTDEFTPSQPKPNIKTMIKDINSIKILLFVPIGCICTSHIIMSHLLGE